MGVALDGREEPLWWWTEFRRVEFSIDIWLRGDNHATTEVIQPVESEPGAWTDADVSEVLIGMLRALERAKNSDQPHDGPIMLRGFSWIVSPLDDGVVIAMELSLGAVVAGPFDIPKEALTEMIDRVVSGANSSTKVH
jgi:hypothetical protein